MFCMLFVPAKAISQLHIIPAPIQSHIQTQQYGTYDPTCNFHCHQNFCYQFLDVSSPCHTLHPLTTGNSTYHPAGQMGRHIMVQCPTPCPYWHSTIGLISQSLNTSHQWYSSATRWHGNLCLDHLGWHWGVEWQRQCPRYTAWHVFWPGGGPMVHISWASCFNMIPSFLHSNIQSKCIVITKDWLIIFVIAQKLNISKILFIMTTQSYKKPIY